MKPPTRYWTGGKKEGEQHPTIQALVRQSPDHKWVYRKKTGQAPKSRQCDVLFCRKFLTRNALKKKIRMCSRCSLRLWRIWNPIEAKFRGIKERAAKYGIPFEITLPEFRKFCLESGYSEKAGRSRGALQLDRKDPLKGYSWDNLQLLLTEENSRKGAGPDRKAHAQKSIDECYADENPF